MKIATQTKILSGFFGVFDSVKIIAESGFDCIDVTFSEPDMEVWFKDVLYKKKAKQLSKWSEELGVFFNQAHAPVPTDGEDEKYNEEVYQKILRTIEISSLLGIKNVVLHPKDYIRYSGTYEETREQLRNVNLEFFNSLVPYCKDYNVNVAVENTYWGAGKTIEKSYCSGAEDIIDLVDTINSPYMVACIDLGHLALAGECHKDVINALGKKRLKCLHVQDNEFIKDIHLLPGLGKIDYEEIIRALADIDYEGELTLESYGFIKGFEQEFVPEVVNFMARRAKFLAAKFDEYKRKNDRKVINCVCEK